MNLGCMLLFWLVAGWSPDQTSVAAARAYREANGARILKDFAEFLAIPNVASDLPQIRRNASYIVAEFSKRGADMELLELDGVPPVVFGMLKAPCAERTLLLYAHYDGQPVNPDKWTHDPWRATLYTRAMEAGGQPRPLPEPGEAIDPEWRIYARSAGDDKAPIPAILAALDALRESGIALTSNLKFFFEGEEEAGSPHLGTYIEKYRQKLEGSIWLFFDGPVHQSRRPQVVFGVRGVTGLEVTVYGANRSLHSGHYGNWAPVPGQRLAHLLASMKAENGRVLIDGFYDSVLPLGETEREALKRLPRYDDAMRKDMGLAWTEADNAPYMERLLLPTLTIKGMASGDVGPLARNVIPQSATANLGVRLVKGNDPKQMLDLVEAHIRGRGYHILREDPDPATRRRYPKIAKVTREGGYPAARTAMDLPIVAPIVAAVEQASGTAPYLVPGLGGSLPLFYFTQLLRKPAIIVPLANHDDNQHAPDENLRLANLWYGIDLYAALFTMADEQRSEARE